MLEVGEQCIPLEATRYGRIQTASPKPVRDFAATLQDSRERRRREIERELQRELGGEEVPITPAEDTPRVPLTRACPARPPKPKPHRPLALDGGATPLPTTRRWKSALLPVWPDRVVKPDPAASDVERTVAAATLDLAPGHVGRHERDPSLADASVLPEIDRAAGGPARGGGHAARGVACASGGPPPRTRSGAERPDSAASERSAQGSSLTCATGLAAHARTDLLTTCARSDVRSAQRERIPCDGPGLAAAAAVLAAHDLEERRSAERVSRLASSAQRLRENAARLRLDSGRLRTAAASDAACERAQGASCAGRETSEPSHLLPCALSIPQSPRARNSVCSPVRAEAMRRRIAELDEINALERERLEQEQRDAEARRREQEAFERSVQEQVDRDLQRHREQEARESAAQALREEELQREREERDRRRRGQQQLEELQSKRLGDRCREARSDAAVARWQLIEEELDRQWAEQEAEERRRIEEYASSRRRQFQELDRQLASERRVFASDAEFRDAAAFQRARNAAHADEVFYGARRPAPDRAAGPRQGAHENPQAWRDGGPGRTGSHIPPDASLSPEEKHVVNELQAMRSAPREAQKAKIKELLLRWHPDKNQTCVEKATRVFQFVQQQRGAILGL